MKKTFYRLAQGIDPTTFNSAKESLLKSLDELEKTKNGFWLGLIWDKESRGHDFYTSRRKQIEDLTPSEVQIFVKQFLETSHIAETLMQPNR